MLVSPAARMQTMQFPAGGRRGGWDRRSDEDIEKDYNEAVGELDALAQVVRGEMKLMIEVNRAGDITNALEWAEGRGLTGQVILAGCAEGWRVAEAIAEAGVPCLVGPVLAVPTRESDRYDRAYANPGLMQRAGVRVAIRSTDGNGNYRNLPYHAGFAAAYGMGRDAALYAVTLGAAQILGIDDRVGSLEVGKEATLFLADGDPFETGTDVTEVFIQGYRMPMATRQTRLYREFLDRQPGLTETPDGSLR
jgi:imidazolonepropionase-like amidohydrolase